MNRKHKSKESMKSTGNTKEEEIMNRETLKTKAKNILNRHGMKRLGKDWRTKLIRVSGTLGIFLLLGLGIFGQMGWLPTTNPETGTRTGWFGTKIAKASESSNWNPFAETEPQTNLQLSKEYIYAGSRLLAIEEAGSGNPNPTPTPPSQIWEGTNADIQVNADNSLTVINGNGYKTMNAVITLDSPGDWVEQVYTADTTQGALGDIYGQYFAVLQGTDIWRINAYNGLLSTINGTQVSHGVTHTNGDVMRFQRGSNGDILYYKNGVLAFTLTGAYASDPNQPLDIRFRLYYGNWENGAVFPPLTFGSVPQIWAGTNADIQVNADNSLTVINGGGYKTMNSVITLDSPGDWVEQVYTADTSQGALGDIYGQYFAVLQGTDIWRINAYNGLLSTINGTQVSHGVTHTNGDVMRFERGSNGDILYYKNGVLASTLTGAYASDPNQPLDIRFRLYYGNWENGAVFPPLTYGSN